MIFIYDITYWMGYNKITETILSDVKLCMKSIQEIYPIGKRVIGIKYKGIY